MESEESGEVGEAEAKKVKKEITTMTMYYLALINDWQGVSRLILDAGHKSSLAMEDAIKANKFQLLCTHLAHQECSQTTLVRLAEFAESDAWMITIAKLLLKQNKVKIDQTDENGR